MDIQYWYPVTVKYYQPATHGKWIIDTFGKDSSYDVDVMTYYFEKEEHAILFALHWS